jgi:hypothetical protein
VVQPTPESLIVNTLTKITEHIQINSNNEETMNLLLTRIKDSVQDIIEDKIKTNEKEDITTM